ncbi:MAG: Winged helix-turn-helix transcription repressor, HrcA DNA-binding [Candidatus Methanolliviera sp. GoM_asphalt]|nr:MAG: Winged helix-turn-helix transcription repressor, HrcA DNA-binding [Candidatus Methanolliviera sp. GoM_asphalt]
MSLKLTPIQRETLMALISIYRKKGTSVRGDEIAALIDRNPGTVRNQMQTMKALGLVEGVPGPKGGYNATIKAFEAVKMEEVEEEAVIGIWVNKKLVENSNVQEMAFTTVRHPGMCRTEIKIIGDMRAYNIGDNIVAGPTPVNKIVVSGEIIGKDDMNNVILVDATDVETLPKRPVGEYMDKFVIMEGGKSIEDAKEKMEREKLESMAVLEEGEIRLVSDKDVLLLPAEGRGDERVGSISKSTISIDMNTPLHVAIVKMREEGVRSILISDGDKKVGILNKVHIVDVITEDIMDKIQTR